MWSELALHFLGTVTNPVIVALPALLLLATRRKFRIVAATAVAAALMGVSDALHEGPAGGAAVLATSAVAGVVAAEVVLAIVLPLGMLALSGVLWWRGRGRPGSDGGP
jgi:hypothetical protein